MIARAPLPETLNPLSSSVDEHLPSVETDNCDLFSDSLALAMISMSGFDSGARMVDFPWARTDGVLVHVL